MKDIKYRYYCFKETACNPVMYILYRTKRSGSLRRFEYWSSLCKWNISIRDNKTILDNSKEIDEIEAKLWMI